MKIADAAVSQSNRRYYNKQIVHNYGKSMTWLTVMEYLCHK